MNDLKSVYLQVLADPNTFNMLKLQGICSVTSEEAIFRMVVKEVAAEPLIVAYATQNKQPQDSPFLRSFVQYRPAANDGSDPLIQNPGLFDRNLLKTIFSYL